MGYYRKLFLLNKCDISCSRCYPPPLTTGSQKWIPLLILSNEMFTHNLNTHNIAYTISLLDVQKNLGLNHKIPNINHSFPITLIFVRYFSAFSLIKDIFNKFARQSQITYNLLFFYRTSCTQTHTHTLVLRLLDL